MKETFANFKYLGGSRLSSCGIISIGRLWGKLTWNWMMSLPFSNGFRYCGIPSFRTHLTSPCFITSPGMAVMTKSRSSNVRMTFWNPQRASTNSSSMRITRLSVDRLMEANTKVKSSTHPRHLATERNTPYLNIWCSFSSKTITISPGSSPGSWSPSPLNIIFCPSCIPLSTCTSKTFLSRITWIPLNCNFP